MKTASPTATARSPLTRIVPIPPLPGGVLTAAIVSRIYMPSYSGAVKLIFNKFVDVHLLADSQEIIDQPVKDQPGWKTEKHKGKNDRQRQHHLLLHRFHLRWGHLLLDEHGNSHYH